MDTAKRLAGWLVEKREKNYSKITQRESEDLMNIFLFLTA